MINVIIIIVSYDHDVMNENDNNNIIMKYGDYDDGKVVNDVVQKKASQS